MSLRARVTTIPYQERWKLRCSIYNEDNHSVHVVGRLFDSRADADVAAVPMRLALHTLGISEQPCEA